MSKDCDQPRNMDNVTCRNCEKTGHFNRDCPEPKDCMCHPNSKKRTNDGTKLMNFKGSKVQCSNCQQYGHTKVRCKEPLVQEDNGFGQAGDNSNGSGAVNGWPSGEDNTGSTTATNCGW